VVVYFATSPNRLAFPYMMIRAAFPHFIFVFWSWYLHSSAFSFWSLIYLHTFTDILKAVRFAITQ